MKLSWLKSVLQNHLPFSQVATDPFEQSMAVLEQERGVGGIVGFVVLIALIGDTVGLTGWMVVDDREGDKPF